MPRRSRVLPPVQLVARRLYRTGKLSLSLDEKPGGRQNHKRVGGIWRREALKVPQRQPKRGRLWLNDGSCIRLRPEYPGHV
jgi:hypothetical protein